MKITCKKSDGEVSFLAKKLRDHLRNSPLRSMNRYDKRSGISARQLKRYMEDEAPIPKHCVDIFHDIAPDEGWDGPEVLNALNEQNIKLVPEIVPIVEQQSDLVRFDKLFSNTFGLKTQNRRQRESFIHWYERHDVPEDDLDILIKNNRIYFKRDDSVAIKNTWFWLINFAKISAALIAIWIPIYFVFFADVPTRLEYLSAALIVGALYMTVAYSIYRFCSVPFKTARKWFWTLAE